MVSGASTGGECPAPGMQTRWAPSRPAISSWTAGGHASSFSPYRTRTGGPSRSASCAVRSGQASRYLPMATRPTGLLPIMRSCRKAITWSGTASALASGSSCSRQICATVARRPASPDESIMASMPRSISARWPLMRPGPELSKVSEMIGAVPASAASLAISPPRECPSRCRPWPSAMASVIAAMSAASSPGAYASAPGAPGLSYCPRMSIAKTRRPADASDCRTGMKSSLLPVKPGMSSAGLRSHTPMVGSASSAAKQPRRLSIVTRRTRSGSSSVLGMLTAWQPNPASVASRSRQNLARPFCTEMTLMCRLC